MSRNPTTRKIDWYEMRQTHQDKAFISTCRKLWTAIDLCQREGAEKLERRHAEEAGFNFDLNSNKFEN